MADHLFHLYIPLIPSHYRVRSSPQDAVRDITYLETLSGRNKIAFNMERFEYQQVALSGVASMIYIYSLDKIDLIHIMPILQNLGLHVIDQLTTKVGNRNQNLGYIQSFRVLDCDGNAIDEDTYRDLIGCIIIEVFNDRTENDTLNQLALRCGLDWRAINVIQLYRNVYLQLDAPFSKGQVHQALLMNPQSTKYLFDYFEAKFSCKEVFGDLNHRKKNLQNIDRDFIDSLQSVEDIASDIILRRVFNLMTCTLRTNFYIPNSPAQTAISIKLDSEKVQQMPSPSPFREIYVHDVHMEGTHLRFGSVSRGGVRWSDRISDFRSEVLGLVKTQQAKNVVIVPEGSKGGFVVKKQAHSKEEAQDIAKEQYRRFIQSLLDITDNVDTEGQVHHPSHVLCYDTADPYLVVAADK
ncbi:MAG: NAD-glutamate dehydrogenase, partial [Candidatus Margulisbacteria bacterium]|nr:NAD-glutamate dehydrogenase [Candidatus Margulisiibacteriota bacterium]